LSPRFKIWRAFAFFKIDPYITVDKTERAVKFDGLARGTHVEFRTVGRASVTSVRIRA